MSNVAQTLRLAAVGLALISLVVAVVARGRRSANGPVTPALMDSTMLLPLGMIVGILPGAIGVTASVAVAASTISICILLFAVYRMIRAAKPRA